MGLYQFLLRVATRCGGVPLNQIAHVGVSVSSCLKLFGREIIFEVFQPVLKTYLVTDGRTTEAYNLTTALCLASRGKNCQAV